jgi:PAS domain S-box-containing protein
MSEMIKRTRFSLMFIWMSVIILVSGIATLMYTTLLTISQTKELISTTDARLLMAAEMSREILGPDYHNTIIDSTSVSQEQYNLIVKRNDDLCRRLGLQYLWSVLSVDDQFVFTSATHSDIEDPASPSAAFFEVHRDPGSFQLAMESNLTPVFSTFNNEWGEGRQVLVPRIDENGRTYIFGASIQLTKFNNQIYQSAITSIAIGTAIMVGAFLLTFFMTRRLKKPITRLIETANNMAGGELDIHLPFSRVNELQSISTSLDQLRIKLKQRLDELKKSNELLDATQRLTQVGGWEWDVAQQSMFWTNETYLIHGLSPKEIPPGSTEHIKKSISCYEPETRPIIQAAFQDCIEKGLPYSFEVPLTNFKGERLWVRTQAEVVRENGKIVRVVGNIMDITERKLTESAISESEAKYRLLVENANDIVYSLTLEGVFTYVSPIWTKFLGHAVSEVENQSFQMFVHPDDIPECLKFLEKTITTRENQSGVEYRLRHKDGTWRWHTTNGSPICDEDGKVVSFLGISHDITERKKMVEEREHLSRLVDDSPASITIYDVNGKFLYANAKTFMIHGYSRDEFMKLNVHQLDVPESEALLEARIRQVMQDGEASFEVYHFRKDGSRLPLQIFVRRTELDGEKVIESIAIDLTEHKKIEKDLLESEERYRSLHNASFGGIAIHDKGIILECNQGLSDMSGFSVDELRSGMDGLMLIAPESRELVRSNMASGYEKPYEAFCIRKNGEKFPVRLEARNIPYKGKKVRTVEFRDITEQKLAEEKLRENRKELVRLLAETEHSRQALLSLVEDQKEAEEKIRKLNLELEERVRDRTVQLEISNKELEAFSYSVSHDLRAPLRGIDGWSQALKEDYEDKLDEKGVSFIDRIRSETTRMGQLIEGLLQLSRFTQMEMNRESVDLSALAQEIWGRLDNENYLSYEFIIQPGLVAMADRNLISVVLTNLIGNSAKFSSKTPDPRIEFGKTLIDGKSTYFIHDNGAGFDMAFAHNLFGTFQRMHKQSEFPGTGIGLSTVQRIINRHAGKVWAEAEVGKGATFYFTLSED